MKRWISVLGPSAFAPLAIAIGVLCGCASSRPSQPPRELQAARDAYTRAESGPAREHNQAGLIEARQALDAAEQKYNEKSDEVKPLSYVAQRKAQIAEADGRAAAAVLGVAEEERASAGRSERRAKVALDRLGLAAKEESRGTVITLPGANMFATNEAEILPAARGRLAEIAKAVKQVVAENAPQDVGRKLVLIGYTDDVGSEETNLDLSARRADAVRAFFSQHGLSATMMETVGRGEADPIADNGTAQGRAKNRRVEVVVTPATPSPAQQ